MGHPAGDPQLDAAGRARARRRRRASANPPSGCREARPNSSSRSPSASSHARVRGVAQLEHQPRSAVRLADLVRRHAERRVALAVVGEPGVLEVHQPLDEGHVGDQAVLVLVGRRLEPRVVHLRHDLGRPRRGRTAAGRRCSARCRPRTSPQHCAAAGSARCSVMIGCGPTSTRNSPNVPGGVGSISGSSCGARLPVDQVVGPGVVDRALAEVHQPAAVDLPVAGSRRPCSTGSARPSAFGSKVLKSGNSGPCFSQVNRSVEVARHSWALVRSHAGVGQVVGAVDLGDPRVLAAERS